MTRFRVLMIVGAAVMTITVSASLAVAASSSITLSGGKTVQVICAGQRLSYTAASRTNWTVSCQPSAPTPTPSASSPTPTPSTTSPTASPTTASATSTTGSGRTYPLHSKIVATTFWVGEIFDANLSDGSQICSTYDAQWAFDWSGKNLGTVPNSDPGCPASPWGGCDGVSSGTTFDTFTCATEARTSTNGYFPTKVTPRENPFYLDLPFDDINDTTAYNERCAVIPWANDPGFAGKCDDQNFSYLKNHWVKITGPNGHTCYGQVEDAGPSHGSLYHDANYVFGTNNAQPVQGQFNNAGADVSPALNGCLGFADLDGDNDRIAWQFTDASNVPAGAWTKVITSSGVDN